MAIADTSINKKMLLLQAAFFISTLYPATAITTASFSFLCIPKQTINTSSRENKRYRHNYIRQC